MKLHPILLVLLVVSALGGAFAIGRLSQVSSNPAGALPESMSARPSAAQIQLVPTGRQQAEIETPQGTFTIEAGIETQ